MFGALTVGLLLALTAAPRSSASLSCLDESGQKVDWWFLAKHPKAFEQADAAQDGGTGGGYVYMTSKTASAGRFQPGSKLVTDASSLFGQELADIYSGSIQNYIFYNDELPNGTWTEEYGHTKGYLAWDDSSAFWVQHSVPKFPNFIAGGYLYGEGQEWYGQHGFCMSMSKKNVDEVAAVMKYSNPLIYEKKSDGSLPNVEELLGGKMAETGTVVHDMALQWGTVRLFGKSSAAHENILLDVMTPNLKVGLLSQSWLNSGGPFGSTCRSDGLDVMDVAEIELSSSDTHDTHKDHSKWAVAMEPSSAWACGVDNNHVRSQLRRAGLAACMQQEGLSGALRAAAVKVSPCGSAPPSPAPSPSPPPPSPPSPSPSPTPAGSCCYYHDTSCMAGMTCCSGSGHSYRSEGSCTRYGGHHHCQWDGSSCVVHAGNAAGAAEAIVV